MRQFKAVLTRKIYFRDICGAEITINAGTVIRICIAQTHLVADTLTGAHVVEEPGSMYGAHDGRTFDIIPEEFQAVQ